MWGFVTDQGVWGCLSAAELNKGHRGILTIPEPPINHPLPSHQFLKRLIQPLSPTESPWFTSSIEHRARVMILCWWCWHFFAYVLLLPSLLSPSKMCCKLIHSAILFPLLTLLQHWTENWVCKFTAINILCPVNTLLICLTISIYDTRIPLKCTFFPQYSELKQSRSLFHTGLKLHNWGLKFWLIKTFFNVICVDGCLKRTSFPHV